MDNHSTDNYRLPAEWEPQRAVLLTWPHEETDWQPYLAEITQTFLQLAKAIARHERLIIATACPGETQRRLSAVLSADEMRRVTIYDTPTNDTWARDHGPITLVPQDACLPCHLLDFKFNAWGEKFPWEKDNAITLNLAAQGAFDGIVEDHADFVLEGGSIESDGQGTIMTTSSCLLAPHRNEPMDKAAIERYLLRALHARRLLWVDHGQLMGDDTDGHIDTTVRFAPNDTLLYIGCDDPDDPQYEDFRQMEAQLRTFRTMDGRPYRLLRLPMPDAIYDTGEQLTMEPTAGAERLPATYANFLVTGGAVIVPVYNQPEKDLQALSIIREAFPDRELIAIDARVIIRQHGSIHCLTMQIPR